MPISVSIAQLFLSTIAQAYLFEIQTRYADVDPLNVSREDKEKLAVETAQWFLRSKPDKSVQDAIVVHLMDIVDNTDKTVRMIRRASKSSQN